jgi:hypothetical protein
MKPRSKRSKAPSRYRCLKHFYWPLVALLFALTYSYVIRVISDLARSLTGKPLGSLGEMPTPLIGTLSLMAEYGLVACAYGAYRDFTKVSTGCTAGAFK